MECVTGAVSMHGRKPVQKSIDMEYEQTYYPITSITGDGPLQFDLEGGVNPIDPSSIELFMEVQIEKDGIELTEQGNDVDNVALINNAASSLFSDVIVTIQDRQITPANQNYGYLAYLQTLFGPSSDAYNSHLQTSGWYLDTAANFNSIDFTDKMKNKGGIARHSLIKKGRHCMLATRLFVNICEQPANLPPHVGMRIKFIRSPDEFVLMGGPHKREDTDTATDTGDTGVTHTVTDASAKDITPYFKLRMRSAKLLVKRSILKEVVLSSQIKSLAKEPATYPILHKYVITRIIPEGVTSVQLDPIFKGKIPRRCVVGLVSNAAYTGQYHENPYQFNHENLNKIVFNIDGQQYPSSAYEPDFSNVKNYNFLREYLSVARDLNLDQSVGVPIRYGDYSKGFALYGFDLMPFAACTELAAENRTGTAALHIGFAKPTDKVLTVIIYAEEDAVVKVNKDLTVTTDLSV